MNFGGFQKLTVQDFPGHVACIAFTKGCNFRCPFCHNALLVENGDGENHDEGEILSYLSKRKGVLDGIVITGGEPLMHPQLEDFLKKVKDLGYHIKIDTNGSYPKHLKSIVEQGLVDYVAMDIKNTPEKYSETAGVDILPELIDESINFLMQCGVDYEFRTTVCSELHTIQDIVSVAKKISGAKRYFLQNFVDSGHILGENLSPVSAENLEKMALESQKFLDFVKTR